jgi:hypothetical protein
VIDNNGARRTTIARATPSECGALFIADTGELALLVPEVGSPVLCLRA